MQTVKYVYWEEAGGWLGYLQDFPDYWTQGESLEDLQEHLRDLYADLSGGRVPGIRRVDDLIVSNDRHRAASPASSGNQRRPGTPYYPPAEQSGTAVGHRSNRIVLPHHLLTVRVMLDAKCLMEADAFNEFVATAGAKKSA